ncbi:hypothetical protein A2U01_0083935, partial [Trifolium medium]|nr:hypothetical protein [Trifolium medium]
NSISAQLVKAALGVASPSLDAEGSSFNILQHLKLKELKSVFAQGERV